MTLRSCRFAQRYNLSLQTWCRHLFKTNYKFWPFFGGHLEGHISYFSKSNPSNAANLYRQVIFRQRFDTVTHLGQMTQFFNLLHFLGHPGDQTGIKKSQSFMLTVVRSTCHRHCYHCRCHYQKYQCRFHLLHCLRSNHHPILCHFPNILCSKCWKSLWKRCLWWWWWWWCFFVTYRILRHWCLSFYRFHKLIWKLLCIEPQRHTFIVRICVSQWYV